jgi:anaerobic selenocysteine-containing dehydrogenase
MLNYIIENNLYDAEFVSDWCYGFDELAESVKEYTLEKTAEITWIDKDKIAAAADLYATKGGIVQWGVAVDESKEATPAGQAIAAIFEITGNIDKPGAMIAPPSLLAYYGGWGEDLLTQEDQDKKFGADKYGLIKYGFRNASTDETLNAIETGEPSPVKGAWLQCTNFLACTSQDPKRTLAAFRTMDFIVGIDLFMTPTLEALADIVLPSVTFPERDGLRIGDGVQRGETMNKTIEPLYECKPDQLVDLEISHKWSDNAWPWDTEKEMYSSILEELGIDYDQLAEKAPVYLDFEYEKYKTGKLRPDGKPGFNTQTGRIELWSTYMNISRLPPLPYYDEPDISPISTPDKFKEFPLILTTGARHWGMFHSEHRMVPRLRELCYWPQVQINKKTALEHSLVNGDWVWVESPYGRAQRQVEVTDIMRDGVVNADHGWWLPEAPASEDEGLFGLWDVDINQCFPYGPGKSGLGSALKNTLCKIYKVDERDRIDLKIGDAKIGDGNVATSNANRY